MTSTSTSTFTFLSCTLFAADTDLALSDQILVPRTVWEMFDRAQAALSLSLSRSTVGHGHGHGHGLLFVGVGMSGDGEQEQKGVGRLRIALPEDNLSEDACRIPPWMCTFLGLGLGLGLGLDFEESHVDHARWVSLTLLSLPIAHTICLRARTETTLTESMDPLTMLTAALSGADGGLSWAVLTTGAELPLVCGIFDVMEIRVGTDTWTDCVSAATILDCDVRLELMPALDHPRTPTPIPPPPFSLSESATLHSPTPMPMPSVFVPFSGVGRRMCDP